MKNAYYFYAVLFSDLVKNNVASLREFLVILLYVITVIAYFWAPSKRMKCIIKLFNVNISLFSTPAVFSEFCYRLQISFGALS